MSIVPKETIEVIAQGIGILGLSHDGALALASDVEYRVREIMQEAIKCMRHSKRTALAAGDVDAALNLRNMEPLYGFSSGDPLPFKQVTGRKHLFYVDDKDVEFKDVIDAPLTMAHQETAVIPHWLAVEGVQLARPESPVEVPMEKKKVEYKEDGILVDARLPVKHLPSRELQLYYEKITELTVTRSRSVLFKEALVSLSTDSGLQPLVAKFICFIADQVQRNFNDFSVLFALIHVVRSLLRNPQIHIEPYLHQVMPSLLTCLGTRRLGDTISDSHWEVRNIAADLLALICKRYGHSDHCLQSRLVRTLLDVFLDPTKALVQHYGAIKGLAALGPSMVRFCILPNLESYLQLLKPEMGPEQQESEMKKIEAWHVYGALLKAAGSCIYDSMKLSCNLLRPPAHAIWKSNVKIAPARPDKHKAVGDNVMQLPAVKKVAAESASSNMQPYMQVEVQGVKERFPVCGGCFEAVGPAGGRRLSSESVGSSNGRRETSGAVCVKRSGVPDRGWSGSVDAGRLMVALVECFGESILCFAPSHELACFL